MVVPIAEEEEFDELLSGLTDAQVNYVYSYCMNWDPIMEEPFLITIDWMNWI